VSDSVIEQVLAHLKQVKQTGHGWSAQCPGHDDRQNREVIHARCPLRPCEYGWPRS
jgi:hypothetical protein